MAIGEVFLGAILAVLFEKLASPHVREFLKRLKIRPRLQKLESRLTETQQLLGDAENKQIKSELAKNWLGSLRDWAYDAEDLLDEFATKSMQFQLKRAADVVDMGRCSKVVRALISFLVSNVIFIGYRLRAAGKIDKICARLDDFYAQEARLGLVVGVKDAGDTWQRTPTSSVDSHPSLYGRADVEKQIIDLLGIETGQGSSGANNLDVVAIVGMGGIGKTSLARHVFNNASVQKHFQLKGWVCVSSQFDVAKATKAILEEFQVNIGEVSQLNALQTKLKDKLAEEKKKFLLVLDDVCFTSSDDWHSLRAPLKAVALPGSKVIVTTRHETAASMMCTIKPFILEGLSDADCLSVFRQHAFENDPSTSYPDVEPFHPKILEKCKGLPLAARELGVLLRGIQPDYWDVTLNSDILGLPEAAEGGISPTLWVSYHHLPSQLKRCFSYCSVLPKSYQFGEEEIVLLWMAEGLIADQRWVDMEDLGGAYFRELLSRSLFRYANDHKSRFVMDDGVNELARLVAGKSCVNLEDDHNKNGSFENARHVSYSQNFICEKCENMKSLRAVLPFTASYGSYSFLPFTASYGDYDFLPFTASHGDYGLLLKLLPKLKFLRALGLRGFDVGELPKEIGELIHLRYMDLSYTAIIKLPESTCLIRNLQTLKLKCCWRLQTLPEDMRKLTSLRHLDLSLCGSLQSMPIGLDKLTCLRTISICVPGGGGDAITAVKNLVHLGNSLRRLELKWLNQRPGNDVSIPQDSSIALDVLDLQSHQGLEILNIQGFPGLAFSRWIAVSNVRVLTLQEIEACRILPPLGKMPNLETLKIINFLSLSAVGKEFYGEGNSVAFPKLKSLRFQGMREWKEWRNPSSAGCFPQLGELHIRDCEKLVFDLPTQLPSLSRLHIKRCNKVLIRNAMELRSLVSADALEIGGVEAMECFFTDDDWVDDRDAQLLYWLSKQVIPNVDLTELIYGALRADKHVWAHNVLHSLTSFTIRGIAQLSLLGAGAGAGAAGRILGELLKLKQLKIEKCENLCGCVWPLDSSLAGSTSADMLLLPTSLKELEIYCCEKLEFVAVDSSCSLEFLTIGECSLLSSITSSRGLLPASLRELRIQNCKKLEIVAASLPLDSSLELLVLSDCSSLTRLLKCADADLPASLRELDIQNCEKLEIVAASWLVDSSLEVLVISDCSSLRRLTSTDMVLPASLIALRIRNCKNLEIVASSWPMDSSSSSLGELEISNCSSLTRLTCTDIVLPASLIELRIRNCNKLEIVAAGWLVDSSLEELVIWGCSSLTRLTCTAMPLPASLRVLEIRGCEKLEIVSASWLVYSSLEVMVIWGCSSLTRLTTSTDMALPASLAMLKILNCEKLEFVGASWPIDSLSSLTVLEISDCPSLTRLTSTGVALPASLIELRIRNCKSLEIVASRWPVDSSLKVLVISDCSSLTRLTTSTDMELPASLVELRIWNCKKLEFVGAGWPIDSSLTVLEISNCSSLTRLTSTGMALPASLIELRIRNCKSLEIVASRWPVDSSLKVLVISDCSSLTRLTSTDMALPASLVELRIWNCEKLEVVLLRWPIDSSSLKELEISDCSSLTRLTSAYMVLPASLKPIIRNCNKLSFAAASLPIDSSSLEVTERWWPNFHLLQTSLLPSRNPPSLLPIYHHPEKRQVSYRSDH